MLNDFLWGVFCIAQPRRVVELFSLAWKLLAGCIYITKPGTVMKNCLFGILHFELFLLRGSLSLGEEGGGHYLCLFNASGL